MWWWAAAHSFKGELHTSTYLSMKAPIIFRNKYVKKKGQFSDHRNFETLIFFYKRAVLTFFFLTPTFPCSFSAWKLLLQDVLALDYLHKHPSLANLQKSQFHTQDSSTEWGWSYVGRSKCTKKCNFLHHKIGIKHLVNTETQVLLGRELCCKMPFTDLMAFCGGLTMTFYLLKLAWACWHGFREFFLSKYWQVDLRTYGQWAGEIKATILHVLFQVEIKVMTTVGCNFCHFQAYGCVYYPKLIAN